MHTFVKNCFYILGVSTLALMLYYVFFGTIKNGGNWEGALYYSARQVENPIGAYYFNYCYVPSTHSTDYLDVELGCKVNGKGSVDNISVSDYRAIGFSEDAGVTLPTGSYSTGFK